MKYFTVIITLLIIFVILIIFDNTITFFFNVLIIPFFYLTLFLWEYSIFDKKIEADFKIRANKKSLNIYDLVFAIWWTLIIGFGSITFKFKFLFVVAVWASFIVNLVMIYLYKKKNPYTLFIDKNQLIVLERWIQKRNISGLNQIQFDRINKKISLSSDKGYKIKINTKEHCKEDVDKFLEIIIDKSVHPVFIPKNYQEE